jgi:hypothetical protein
MSALIPPVAPPLSAAERFCPSHHTLGLEALGALSGNSKPRMNTDKHGLKSKAQKIPLDHLARSASGSSSIQNASVSKALRQNPNLQVPLSFPHLSSVLESVFIRVYPWFQMLWVSI